MIFRRHILVESNIIPNNYKEEEYNAIYTVLRPLFLIIIGDNIAYVDKKGLIFFAVINKSVTFAHVNKTRYLGRSVR